MRIVLSDLGFWSVGIGAGLVSSLAMVGESGRVTGGRATGLAGCRSQPGRSGSLRLVTGWPFTVDEAVKSHLFFF